MAVGTPPKHPHQGQQPAREASGTTYSAVVVVVRDLEKTENPAPPCFLALCRMVEARELFGQGHNLCESTPNRGQAMAMQQKLNLEQATKGQTLVSGAQQHNTRSVGWDVLHPRGSATITTPSRSASFSSSSQRFPKTNSPF